VKNDNVVKPGAMRVSRAAAVDPSYVTGDAACLIFILLLLQELRGPMDGDGWRWMAGGGERFRREEDSRLKLKQTLNPPQYIPATAQMERSGRAALSCVFMESGECQIELSNKDTHLL